MHMGINGWLDWTISCRIWWRIRIQSEYRLWNCREIMLTSSPWGHNLLMVTRQFISAFHKWEYWGNLFFWLYCKGSTSCLHFIHHIYSHCVHNICEETFKGNVIFSGSALYFYYFNSISSQKSFFFQGCLSISAQKMIMMSWFYEYFIYNV